MLQLDHTRYGVGLASSQALYVNDLKRENNSGAGTDVGDGNIANTPNFTFGSGRLSSANFTGNAGESLFYRRVLGDAESIENQLYLQKMGHHG